jgi:flagellar biosynthesis protein
MEPADPRRTAVALAYSGGGSAPRVVAKGRALLADRIVEAAQAAGVAVRESPELAQLLEHLDIGCEIPPSLYVAVAELLAWVRRIENEASACVAPATRTASTSAP